MLFQPKPRQTLSESAAIDNDAARTKLNCCDLTTSSRCQITEYRRTPSRATFSPISEPERLTAETLHRKIKGQAVGVRNEPSNVDAAAVQERLG